MQRTLKSTQERGSIALLSTGDPTFFGLLKPLLEKSSSDLEFEVIPGISSIQVCTSRLQIPLEEIGLILSFHGQPHAEKNRLLEAVRDRKTAIVLPDPNTFRPDQIAKYLLDSGINPGTAAAVCENLTYTKEKITEGDLQMISTEEFEPMCLMVIGHRRRIRRGPEH